MSTPAETLKVLEERRSQILNDLRGDHSDLILELESLNGVIERYKMTSATTAGHNGESSTTVPSQEWSDEKYPKPRHVIVAILRKHGGRAERKEIAREAVDGGWRLGGDSPYYDIISGIDYLLSAKNPILKKSGKEGVALVWSAIHEKKNED